MNIYLTFDYELYFGKITGTANNCILEPSRLLKEIADRHHIPLTFFVDAGYLAKLSEMNNPKILADDYSRIVKQLNEFWNDNHDIQLHIHPHWEDSFFDGLQWQMNTSRYKLSDFSKGDISAIVNRYKLELEKITGPNEIYAFRAGGWCIQPFSCMKDALYHSGIRVDSSVFPGAEYHSDNYAYDFRKAPLKSKWRFDSDPLVEIPSGPFTEIPISGIYNSPLFYWRLFLLGRLLPKRHKPLGDGIPMHAPGQRRKLLMEFTHQTVSVDGYNAYLLKKALRQHEKRKATEMVIIGHPKALTRYGLEAIESFIAANKNKHTFTSFRNQKSNY